MQSMSETILVVNNTIRYLILIAYEFMLALLQCILPISIFAKDVSNEVVLITGGGSGLGRSLAIQFAKLGSRIVIWDIDPNGLYQTKKLIDQENGYQKDRECLAYVVDLAEKESIQKIAKQVHYDLNADLQDDRRDTYVSVLINSAGIYYGRLLMDLHDEQIEKIFKVNIQSHFWTIRAFMPAMIKAGKGHIVEIASMAGIMGYYKQVDYCATKFAAVGLEESLNYELDYLGLNDKIKTTVICPFFFSSNLFSNYSERAKVLMNTDYVASKTIDAIRCNFNRILLPVGFGYLSEAFRFFSPRKAQIISAKALGLDECVRDIKGRAA